MTKNNGKRELILASGSPRRKELLGHLGLNFKVCPSSVEEITEKTIPREVAIDLARLKGDDIFKQMTKNEQGIRPFIISSDTIVVIDQKILGKPKDRSHAKEMLSSLSGRSHEVYTSIYLKSFNNKDEIRDKKICVKTEVSFVDRSEDIMNLYLDSDDPYDKAGAYGIQNQGLMFVDSIKGSYSNVVGFPLSLFINEFKDFIEELGYERSEWQSIFI